MVQSHFLVCVFDGLSYSAQEKSFFLLHSVVRVVLGLVSTLLDKVLIYQRQKSVEDSHSWAKFFGIKEHINAMKKEMFFSVRPLHQL